MDAFQELHDIVRRLQRLTEDSDGVVSVHINARAWPRLEQKVVQSPSLQGMMISDGQGATGRGHRFELAGVEFVDYDRVTGLPTKS